MNTLYTQFRDALQREGKQITSYYANVNYKVLFRQPNLKDLSTDISGTIFYETSIPLYQGQLVTFNGEQYILMNKLPVDGNVYFKSTMLKCNVVFKGTPCYAYKLSLGLDSGTTISTLSGNGELITEHTTAVQNIALDTMANMMNRWFKVVNTYNISGISHLILTVTTAPPDHFTLDATTPSSTIDMSSTTTMQITTVTKNNDDILTGQTFTYSSSDTTKATVSSTGLITAISGGATTITVTWVEKNVTDTIDITVSQVLPAYTMTVVCSSTTNKITIGSSRYFTATLKDGTGTVVPFTPVWTYNWNGMATSNFTITTVTPTIVNTQKIKIAVADNTDLLSKYFDVICTTSDGLNTAKATVQLTAGV
jgi:hypothetical protein